jgi:DNA-binding winged helix-turn-helix (wHTH) protein
MNSNLLTNQEQKTFEILLQKSDSVVSRDEIARAIWGDLWLKKYSDWRIDRLIYLLRRKITGKYSIKTLRNSGYLLSTGTVHIGPDPRVSIQGTLPTKSYLEYMNNPKNPRQTIKKLFTSKGNLSKANNILVVNSYSFDNVDTLAKAYPNSTVFFSNFDRRAIQIHQDRINELGLTNLNSIFDDIRSTIFRDDAFDLIINDFRLNFNVSNSQEF